MAALGALAVLPPMAGARSPRLVLEASGAPAAQGSPAYLTASLGTCGTIPAGGTLVKNSNSKDRAGFTEGGTLGGEGRGICGQGGPSFFGTIEAARLSSSGAMTLLGHVIFVTPTPCRYEFRKLEGSFTVPGTTEATLSGTGKRDSSRPSRCGPHLFLEGIEVTLGPAEGSAFQTVLE